MIEKIRSLRYLPDEDKETLCHYVAISYGHGQHHLPELSIFSKDFIAKSFQNYQYDEIVGRDIFYAGLYPRSNLSIFVDQFKKIFFHSRFYFTHLNAFVENIDACLFHIQKLDMDNCVDIGSDILSIEKWFKSYGHFKDEAYTLGDFLYHHPETSQHRVLLDYPNDGATDTASFKFNPNYINIDRLIFGDRSINAYNYQNKILKLRNLKLIANGFNSQTFHSFPPSVCERIRRQVVNSDTPPGPARIFLTRSNSYRDIGNKAEVEEYFVRAGFTLINPEDITYEELVRHARNTDVVAMYFGSAMTNMCYFKSNTKVFILKSQSYLDEKLSLWSKVIANYHLDIKEVPAVDNVIRPDDLAALDLSHA